MKIQTSIYRLLPVALSCAVIAGGGWLRFASARAEAVPRSWAGKHGENRRETLGRSLAASSSAAGIAAPTLVQQAAPLIVNTAADEDYGACTVSHCSLREAIAAAASGAEIRFASPLFDSAQTITLTNELSINKSLTITGPGAKLLTLSGNNATRVFHLAAGNYNVRLTGLRIANGKDSGNIPNGAGIYNESTGTLTLQQCTLDHNSVSGAGGGYGGGISNNSGTVNLLACTLDHNFVSGGSTGWGGGIYNYSGTVNLLACTLAYNSASSSGGFSIGGAGGGIYNLSGTVNLTACTLDHNSASGSISEGGGIYSFSGSVNLTDCTLAYNSVTSGGGILNKYGTVSLTACTLANNSATSGNGGGIYNQNDTVNLTACTLAYNSAKFGGGILSTKTVTIRNTIVAGNSCPNGPDVYTVGSGTTTSQGYNLIGNNANANITATTGDQLGTPGAPIDPLLDQLANNGGPTPTLALLPGSPAINAGDNAITAPPLNLLADQRGIARDGQVDIGAFESQGFALSLAAGNNQSALLTTAFAAPLVVNVSSAFNEPVQGGKVSFSAPGSGPSATLSANSATIAANGQASVTATANNQAGSYQVTAATTGSPSNVSFQLTNLCPAITAMVSNGGAIRSGQPFTITVTLSGGSAPYSVSLSNVGTQTGSSPLSFTVSPATTTTYQVQSATDKNGCAATVNGSGSATVIVDDTPPTIACQLGQVGVIPVGSSNGPVNYTAPTVSDNNPSAGVSCTPSSGATFALGTTTVNCTATDAAGNTASCSFTVTVRQPSPAIKDLSTRVQALVPATLSQTQATSIITYLNAANLHVQQNLLSTACADLGNAVTQIGNLTLPNGPLSAAQNDGLVRYANKIRNALGVCGSFTLAKKGAVVFAAQRGEFYLR
jgi:CSLREA domain-containing protein